MTDFRISAPPLPYFLACGEDTYEIAQMHPARRAIGVFDLLIVTEGGLFIGEEGRTWEVGPGQALMLRPDAYHYPVAGCSVRTHFYWLHFDTKVTMERMGNGANGGRSDQPRRPGFRQLVLDHRTALLAASSAGKDI